MITLILLAVLSPLHAQEAAAPIALSSSPPTSAPVSRNLGLSAPDFDGARPRWTPLGPLPIDQAGAGRRGFTLPAESANVVAPGRSQFSLHLLASNDFYAEKNPDLAIAERYETHTAALGYRRGFQFARGPRFELGGQVQLHEADNGGLNGFIMGFESFWAALTGHRSAENKLRDPGATHIPLGTYLLKDGRLVYARPAGGFGVGDFSLVAKAALRDADPSSKAARVAARIAFNLPGDGRFTQGAFMGAGVSADKKLLEWFAVHGDARANVALERRGLAGMPLKPASYGGSAGLEFKTSRSSSFGLTLDANSSPYERTGLRAFDHGVGSIDLGYSRRFRKFLAQFYVRENMDVPPRVRGNLDPDVAFGIKLTTR